ncbi:MAG: pitrilysin family protein [Polyangiales bacterium]
MKRFLKSRAHVKVLLASLLALQWGFAQDRAEAEPGTSAPPDLPVSRATLDNGLRVVMSEDHTVPTVAIAVYYDVGSRDEAKGRSGFAHLFEHMMFQGSANIGKGEHFSLVINRGGDANGTTSNDRTNYFETLPANELALGLWLEADRMRSLAITQDNFENQRQTVMEERRQRIDNQPYIPSMLRINELAYGDYWPYAHSTIGDMKDLVDAPLSAVQEFFDTYYAPNNAVLAISGDFNPDEALALVKKYFGDIPARERSPFVEPAAPTQSQERRETMYDANATLPAFHLAYHIPTNRTADHYPLEMLALILGDGESSRLYQTLVKRKEICQDVAVGTDDRRGPDLFSVWAVMSSGHAPKEAQDLVFAEFSKIAKRGVTARELEKAKNRVSAAFVFGLQSNMARAQNLAEFELYWGDANLLMLELDHYLSVTREDIQRVAKKYFGAENRTVLDVLPGVAPGSEEK